MPCNCEYLEPTRAEVQHQTVDRIVGLQNWDMSAVEEYLEKKGAPLDEVRESIQQYKQMILEDIRSVSSYRRPDQAQDMVLHAHMLHTSDFQSFRDEVLIGFDHAPEVEYTPTRSSIDRQLLGYAQYSGESPNEMVNDPIYTSGLLKEDWGFLTAYLMSEECLQFQGTQDQAQEMVFCYLKAVSDGSLGELLKTSSDVRLVLESHIIHTREFRDFKARFLNDSFEYTPQVLAL